MIYRDTLFSVSLGKFQFEKKKNQSSIFKLMIWIYVEFYFQDVFTRVISEPNTLTFLTMLSFDFTADIIC